MIETVQFGAIIFSFTMIYFALIHYKKGTLNRSEIFLWCLIWIVAILIVIFPDFIRVFAKTFFFARLFDMVVFGGFVLVILLSSKAYIITRKNERKMEELVRKNAIKKSTTHKKTK